MERIHTPAGGRFSF